MVLGVLAVDDYQVRPDERIRLCGRAAGQRRAAGCLHGATPTSTMRERRRGLQSKKRKQVRRPLSPSAVVGRRGKGSMPGRPRLAARPAAMSWAGGQAPRRAVGAGCGQPYCWVSRLTPPRWWATPLRHRPRVRRRESSRPQGSAADPYQPPSPGRPATATDRHVHTWRARSSARVDMQGWIRNRLQCTSTCPTGTEERNLVL